MIVRAAGEHDIKVVLFDDWIWERSTDDFCGTREQIESFPHEATYLGGYVDGQIIGLAITHETSVGVKFHFAVLKPYRHRAREFLAAVRQMIKTPLYCDIPDCYREVINFAKRSGFVEHGNGADYVKHGKTYQRTRLWAL